MAEHTGQSRAKKAKGIRVMDGEKVYVGADVHSRSYSVAVWSTSRGQVVAHWTQPASAEKLVDRLTPVKDQVVQVVYEAGPLGYGLVRALRAAGFRADVIATAKMLRTVCLDSKSDRMDCWRLAEHAAKHLLRPICCPRRAYGGLSGWPPSAVAGD